MAFQPMKISGDKRSNLPFEKIPIDLLPRNTRKLIERNAWLRTPQQIPLERVISYGVK